MNTWNDKSLKIKRQNKRKANSSLKKQPFPLPQNESNRASVLIKQKKDEKKWAQFVAQTLCERSVGTIAANTITIPASTCVTPYPTGGKEELTPRRADKHQLIKEQSFVFGGKLA